MYEHVLTVQVDEVEAILNMDAPNLQTVAATVIALNNSGSKPLLLPGKDQRATSAPTKMDNSTVCSVM